MMAMSNVTAIGIFLILGSIFVEVPRGSHIQNVTCLKSSDDVRTCDNGCLQGFYGIYCNKTCSDHCNASCSQDTGKCLTGCEVDWFTYNCTRNCFGHCLKDTCDMDTGDCIYGCEKGYYGTSCNKRCSANCTGDVCDEFGGCTCKKHVQDKACYLHCSENCLDGLCFVDTSARLICSKGCTTEHTGHYCQDWCPSHCSSCSRDGTCSGMSDKGRHKRDSSPCLGVDKVKNKCACCEDKWRGPQCDMECQACRYSYINNTCKFWCDGAYYGELCHLSCPKHCHSASNGRSRCEKESGNCNSGCVQGYYGYKCLDPCNVACRDSFCFQNNGSCISCEPNRYGPKCEYSCGQCENNTCERNGKCICQKGWYGPKCMHKCSKQCKSNKCTIDYKGNPVCLGACGDGFTGDDCLSRCPSGCKTCDRKNGTCFPNQSENYNTINTININISNNHNTGISASVLVPVLVSVLVSVLALVTVIVVIWCKCKNSSPRLCRNRNKSDRKKENPDEDKPLTVRGGQDTGQNVEEDNGKKDPDEDKPLTVRGGQDTGQNVEEDNGKKEPTHRDQVCDQRTSSSETEDIASKPVEVSDGIHSLH